MSAEAVAIDTPEGGKAPNVTGYIDAIEGSRIYGWAWDPQRPHARIAIRVLIAGDNVAALIADQHRADLAANRIGDGAHAFELVLPEGIAAGDAQIHAVCPETGETVLLETPPREGARISAELQETVTRLVRSHRVLHRNLQAALTAIEEVKRSEAPEDGEVGPEVAIIARIETIEAAILRIDALIADQGAKLTALHRSSADRFGRFLSLGAALLAGIALLAASLR
jgi:hypothetical protein